MEFNFLVVDDDEVNLYIMTRLMERAAYKTNMITKTDGISGIDYLQGLIQNKELLPSLILVDINMPISDGWEFLDKFKKMDIPQDIDVYILTSSVFDVDIERSKNYAFLSGFISKPVTVEKLDEIFESCGAETA